MDLEYPGSKVRGIVTDEQILHWKQHLQTIVPQTCYSQYAVKPDDKVHNWGLFTAVSEYMRIVTGLGETTDAISDR